MRQINRRRKKTPNFNYVHMKVMTLRPKEIETYGNDHSKKFLYFLVKETINL